MTVIKDGRLRKLADKDYRHSYLRELCTGWIVHQIRALREDRDWSQARLGQEAGKAQSAIARIEDPAYGKWSLNTLLELAEAFDVALEVRFTDWPSFVRWTDDTSPSAMSVDSFDPNSFFVAPASNELRAGTASNVVKFDLRTRDELVLDHYDRLTWRDAKSRTSKVRFDSVDDADTLPSSFDNVSEAVLNKAVSAHE